MKLLIALTVLAFVTVKGADTIKCTAGAPTKDAANVTDCKPSVTMCHYPAVVADNKFTGYGCGPCPKEAADSCKTCTGNNDKACQAYTAPTHTYHCYVGKNDTTCPAATKTLCFMAKKGYKGKDVKLMNGGCGSCKDAKLNSTFCSECTKNLCNKPSSAMRITAFVAPLVAAVYWML